MDTAWTASYKAVLMTWFFNLTSKFVRGLNSTQMFHNIYKLLDLTSIVSKDWIRIRIRIKMFYFTKQ